MVVMPHRSPRRMKRIPARGPPTPMASTPAGIKVITEHRRAKFDFAIEDTVEAGLSLMGSEVKALRNGEANLNDAYGNPEGSASSPELYLCNAHIGAYKPAAMFAHLPTRKRKLLLHRDEIDK